MSQKWALCLVDDCKAKKIHLTLERGTWDNGLLLSVEGMKSIIQSIVDYLVFSKYLIEDILALIINLDLTFRC